VVMSPARPRSQLARCLQAQMPVHHGSVAACEHRALEAVLRNDPHMRSTAASFLRGFRAYGTSRSMFQV